MILGYTTSNSSIVFEDTYQNNLAGFLDLFLLQLSSSGSFEWSTYLGGSETEFPGNLVVDSNFIYVLGFGQSADFPISNNAYQPALAGTSDTFLSIFNFDHQLVYSSFYGGSSSESAGRMAVQNGKIVVCGSMEITRKLYHSFRANVNH